MRKIIAHSPYMRGLLEDLPKIARSRASVFITGESGTGKEVIAQAIHELSARSGDPFIKVNCAAIPEALLESEFFGHERGSFTGAMNRRLGRFELADKGTLLLDEVSEISLNLQPKLLRAVQEMEFERIGGNQMVKVDVRFIATSNRDMMQAVQQKLFREDLYYRLNVVPVHLPPLRGRREDILPLAEYFLSLSEGERKFSQSAKEKLMRYDWPGNIRELANVIERVVVMGSSPVIEAEHFLLENRGEMLTLNEVEKRHILQTLSMHNHNRSQTAKVLGISTRTLRNKLKSFDGVK